jgi:RNA polymerase sigma-70 factor (ECF subfamily)
VNPAIPLQEWTDPALVAGLRAADPAAFDHAFERYRAPIFGFLVRMTGRREVADELFQETWLRLARNAASLREDTHLRGWLFTVARNLATSHRRWAWLDGERLLELGRAAWGGGDTPFDHAAANEAGRVLEAAVAQLSPALREVFLLVVVERMSPAEAADVLGARPDAVRQRLARARAELARSLPEGDVP